MRRTTIAAPDELIDQLRQAVELRGIPLAALIRDTWSLYAAPDQGDAHHRTCRQRIEQAREPLVIPARVPDEVDYHSG